MFIDGGDFIGRTIERCEQYLAGAREHEQARMSLEGALIDAEQYRGEGTERTAEQALEDQALVDAANESEVWQVEATLPSEWTREDAREYAEALDAEEREYWDEHLSKWCQLHDIELVNGKCSACVSEQEDERRNDL